jgi:acyl-coenzyme A synthetase/AMP-(fatty) acid ligase
MPEPDRRLAQLAERTLASDPHGEALDYEGRWRLWGELRHVADRVSALIEAAGVGGGAPIAFAPRNRPSAVAAELGLIARGHPIQMIYAFQSQAGLARDIEKLSPALVVLMQEDVGEAVLAALQACGGAAIALADADAAAVPGFETSRRPRAADDRPMRIEILTSGTTGPPKRFPLRHDTIMAFLDESVFAGAPKPDSADAPPALNYFPLGNLSGVFITLTSLLNGLRLTLLDRFTLEAWRDYVVRFRPRAVSVPPTYYQALIESDIPREDLASLEWMNAGASPLAPAVQRRFEETFGIPVLISYGASEFGGRVAHMTPEDRAQFGDAKLGSVGRAYGGAQLRIVDPASGRALDAGEEGVLEVIAPRIGPDWTRTADMGVIDEDGFLFLRGRSDGAIMRGGFKILPDMIEQALLEHPAVQAAAVVGVPDQRLGQTPAAAIKLKAGAQAPDIAELEAHLRERVYATHIPTAWRFIDAFPLTLSAKISLPDVARLFDQAPIDELPGYRRRIVIAADADQVRCDLEDDFHCMSVTLRHRDGVATEVTGKMERVTWSVCPGAQGQIKETFEGVALSAFSTRGARKTNCTHLHDMAMLAAAHPDAREPLVYDILVSDPIGGEVRSEFRRNGAPVLAWTIRDGVFAEPAALAGRSVGELQPWIDGLTTSEQEMAKLLRWGTALSAGRVHLKDQSDPSRYPPNCYAFQPERARLAKGVVQIKDFSRDGTPLAPRMAALGDEIKQPKTG